jgi:hypothetical protein
VKAPEHESEPINEDFLYPPMQTVVFGEFYYASPVSMIMGRKNELGSLEET